MIRNRLKKGESTLNKYSTSGVEIKEGDILGYGDNYPCVVLYDKYTAMFKAIEFGYLLEGYILRSHNIDSFTSKWSILGNIEENFDLLKKVPENFDYNEYLSRFNEKK